MRWIVWYGGQGQVGRVAELVEREVNVIMIHDIGPIHGEDVASRKMRRE